MRRVLAALCVLAVTVLVSGALTAAVYARGIAFALGPWGTAAHVPAVALMAALMAVALRKVRGLSREQTGLTLDARDAREGALLLALTALTLIALVALAAALTGSPLARSANPLSLGALALALLSFVGSSAIQQLTTQSLVVTVSPAEGVSRVGIAVGVGLFTLAHVQVSAAPLYLANVALVGLVSTLFFVARPRPSYAAPVGFHAAWNWAQVAVLGAPTPGESHNPLAVFRWPAGPSWLFGGANGLDEGALFTAALVPFFGFALWWRAHHRFSRVSSRAHGEQARPA